MDPFDDVTSNQPGVSPDFWNNLTAFGLATMAAGSRPGATTLGALGQGGLSAMENSRENARARSGYQLAGQDVIGKQIQNAQGLYALQRQNAVNQMSGLPTMPMPNIPGMQWQQPQYQGSSQSQSQSDGTMAPQGDALAQYRQQNGMVTPPIDNERSSMGMPVGSSTPATNSSVLPSSVPTGPTWGPTMGGSRQTQQVAYPSQSNNSYGLTPHIARVANGLEQPASADEAYKALGFAQNPEIAKTLGTVYSNQVQPRQLRGPGSGYVDPLSGQFMQVPEFRDTQGPGGRTITKAVPLGLVSTPLPGSPGMTQQQVANAIPATALQGQTGAAQSASLPAPVANNPMPESGEGFMSKLGPGETKQIDELMSYHSDGEHGELKAYNSAIGAQQNLTQLQSYLDTLNSHQGDPNFLTSGSGSQLRLDIAKSANTAWSMLGGDASKAPISDPNSIAAGQAAYKVANQLGMQLISQQFGASREAASVVMTGIKSVPSMENTPQGARLLLNGAKEVNNNTIDRYNFKDWWARPDGPHPGDLRGADTAFNNAFPPQAYAYRAISQEQPINVNTPGGRAILLPGTKYKAPDGTLRMVPQMSQEQLMQRYQQAEGTAYSGPVQ